MNFHTWLMHKYNQTVTEDTKTIMERSWNAAWGTDKRQHPDRAFESWYYGFRGDHVELSVFLNANRTQVKDAWVQAWNQSQQREVMA